MINHRYLRELDMVVYVPSHLDSLQTLGELDILSDLEHIVKSIF